MLSSADEPASFGAWSELGYGDLRKDPSGELSLVCGIDSSSCSFVAVFTMCLGGGCRYTCVGPPTAKLWLNSRRIKSSRLMFCDRLLCFSRTAVFCCSITRSFLSGFAFYVRTRSSSVMTFSYISCRSVYWLQCSW